MNTDLTFIYFTPADIQVPRVDRQVIVSFCEALFRLGVDVELVTLGIRTLESEAALEHPLAAYRIRERFPVRTIATRIDQRTQDARAIRNGLTRLWVNIAEGMRRIRRQPRERRLVFFCKNYGPALAFIAMRALTRKKLIVLFEAHTTPRRSYQRLALRNVDGVVANSLALGRDLVVAHGIPSERVLGIHQGIDLEQVDAVSMTKEDARRRLGVPADARLVVYAGKIFFGYKEVEYILDAVRALPSDVTVAMVGGRADHVERYRERIAREGLSNVQFTGFVLPTAVQEYLSAADVLVMYYPSGIELNKYRSSGKLFDYMASGRPIVTADFPVLHEVLGDPPAAVMVPPDQPAALAAAVTSLLAHPAEMENLADRARAQVRHFSWEARARAVLEFIG